MYLDIACVADMNSDLVDIASDDASGAAKGERDAAVEGAAGGAADANATSTDASESGSAGKCLCAAQFAALFAHNHCTVHTHHHDPRVILCACE